LPLSVLLFELFIDDIPLGNEDILFMDDCTLFSNKASPEEVYEALQNKLDLIESCDRLKKISFGIQKCFLLPHKLRAKPFPTFFGEPVP